MTVITDLDAIADHVSRFPPENASLVKELRAFFKRHDLEEVISWRQLCYRKGGYVCTLVPHQEYVRIDFFQGTKLKDPRRLLQGRGDKLRHIKITALSDVGVSQMLSWIRQSIQVIERE